MTGGDENADENADDRTARAAADFETRARAAADFETRARAAADFETRARAAFPSLRDRGIYVSDGFDGLPFRLEMPFETPGLREPSFTFTFFDERELANILLKIGQIVLRSLKLQAETRTRQLEALNANMTAQVEALLEVEAWSKR